ncbi:MAG: hypothetical protein M3275_01530 [Thermoproteota archaeon]|nr:hypothetical protein [Thermoproteota archaeon]
MELAYLLDKGSPDKEEGSADLPWLTETDLVQIQQELLFQRKKVDISKLLWFRTDVLSKYKNHGYCEIDMANPFSCVLLFLDYDKKQIVTSTLFEIHNGNIIMIRARDFPGVPPKERNHWQHYQIVDNLHLHM